MGCIGNIGRLPLDWTLFECQVDERILVSHDLAADVLQLATKLAVPDFRVFADERVEKLDDLLAVQ
jgi:hypothetical protein